MNPAFSYKNIQNMVPIFALKAMGLIRRWEGMIAASTNDSSNQRLILEDVCKEFSKVTLDVIGAAGFGYEFNSIKDEHNELNQAYQEILSQISLSPWTIASQLIPGFRYLPFDRNLKMNRAVTTINAVVNKLIDERKAALKSSKEGVNTDLLAMAIAANEAEVASKRMSEEELRGQVMTFLIAGHETTSVSLSWAVFFLALHSDLQDQLFQELQNDLADKYVLPTWEQANSGLRAVENFCKEVLRLVPPVPITNRVAVQDDELQGYHIPKGSLIFLLPGVLHRQQEVWGDDCMQFNPDRWNKTSSVDEGEEAPPASHSAKPYGAFMPFLMGPRSKCDQSRMGVQSLFLTITNLDCIGQKFAMVEFKVILAILVRNFRFEEAEQGDLSKVKKSLFVTWKPDPGVKVLISRRKG